MAKKICIAVIVVCLILIGGKLVIDRATDFAVLKGLDIISHTPVGEWFSSKETAEEQINKSEGVPSPEPEATAVPEKKEEKKESTPSDGIDPADRAYVMGIYSRYSAAEVSEVSSIMSGKPTPEQKARAKAIVFSKMSRAEYARLMELARKYGY